MYVLFAPLKNLKFHKKKHSFYPTTNGSDSKIGLVGSNGFLNDTNPIWDQQTMLAGSPGGRMDV